MKDGIIKYNCKLIDAAPVPEVLITELNKWRNKLHLLALIAEDDDRIGYGNISQRIALTNSFIISGSQTGGITTLEPKHYSTVDNYDIEKNSLTCQGKIKASSESLTHAIIYDSLPEINCVIHIHNKELWEKLLFNELTTSQESLYGSIELVYEIKELLKHVDLERNKIIVLSGHEDGVFFFGKSISDAGMKILESISF